MSATRRPPTPATPEARAHALRDALAAEGRIPDGFLDLVVDRAENGMKPENGARVVARAWVDAAYRERLLRDGTAACAELGIRGPQGESIVVLADTPAVHNVIVCTQCSCTAWPVLGLPPDWYKSPAYRARVVREPRAVLQQMGFDVPQAIELRVWDTSADTRYMVLPLRPAGTEGWSEARLAALVSREAMIGVAPVGAPA